MAEFLLTSSIDPIEKGEKFGGALPRHLTIQQWFTLGLERPFQNALQNYATTLTPLEVTAAEQDLFGPDNDVLVRRLHLGRLAALHTQTKDMLERFGGELKRPDWAGDGFKPHVTYVDGRALEEGEKATLRTIELIRRENGDSEKTVQLVLPFSKDSRQV